MGDKYFISSMTNIVQISIEGKNLDDPKEALLIDQLVESKVKDIIDKLKSSHEKFVDSDFGPNEKDEYGAISLYGSGGSAGAKYPAPDSLKWERPLYDDDIFVNTEIDDKNDEDEDDEYGYGGGEDENEGVICKHGKLFLDGSSSGDVIQGQLGDCWFLGALAVMGAHEKLLQACFWRLDSFKEHGLFVVRFFKDCNIIFIIIDDRLPVKIKDGRLIFASCKDPNELWVPFIEKAYAKLHGCYKALIGGFSHYALGDMTGFCPRLLVLKPGFTGFCEEYSAEQLWNYILKYKSWGCLMGCSIQSNPKDNQKVEAEAGLGLYYGHAYSLLDVNKISLLKEDLTKGYDNKLIKLRNPWGRGEWEGAFGDRTEERVNYDKEISKVFNIDPQEKVDVDFNDGTFFMPFQEWYKRYTSLFIAINFPQSWCSKRCKGKWSGDVGGNRQMGTWLSNPKIKFRLNSKDNRKGDGYPKTNELREVFIGIYIRDSRMTLGFDYYKDPLYATPLAFDIVDDTKLSKTDPKEREVIPFACDPISLDTSSSKVKSSLNVKQPPYNFGSTQVELMLKVDTDYYIVPSLYKRNQPGEYYITVFADVEDFFLENNINSPHEQQQMVIGKSTSSDISTDKPNVKSLKILTKTISNNNLNANVNNNSKELKMSVAQFYEKKELLRDRMTAEAKRLGLSINTISSIFTNQDCLSRTVFKRRMIDLGFNLSDIPDDDLVVLDEDNSDTISKEELLHFIQAGLSFQDEFPSAPPAQPVDDILYKAVDLEGVITVNITNGRNIRESNTWFNNIDNSADTRKIIKYDKSSIEESNKFIKENLTGLNQNSTLNHLPVISEESSSDIKNEINNSNINSNLFNTLDNHISLDLLHSPMKTNRIDDDQKSIATKYTTTDKTKKNKQIETISNKLHSDVDLQKAEIKRINQLNILKKLKNNDLINEKLKNIENNSTLYLNKSNKPIKKDILLDTETMQYLCYHPTVASLNSNNQVNFNDTMILTKENLKLDKDKESIKSNNKDHLYVDLPDLWDSLIDCVITITSSRSKQSINYKQFQLFQCIKSKKLIDNQLFLQLNDLTSKSPVSKPITSLVPHQNKLKGNIPTPKNNRVASGVASVVSKNQSNIIGNANDIKNKLKTVELNQNNYIEIYRRLISIPIVHSNELDGNVIYATNKSNDFLTQLFNKFDLNKNKEINFYEFQFTLLSLNMNISNDDCHTLFNRFHASTANNINNNNEDIINYIEFSTFFNNYVKNNYTLYNNVMLISNILNIMKTILYPIIESMKKYHLTNPEDLLDKTKLLNDNTSSSTNETFKLPDNCILTNLNKTSINLNIEKLKKIGINLTCNEMSRINRVFDYNISFFMYYMSSENINYDILFNAIQWIDNEVWIGISERTGIDSDGNITTNNAKKLWSSLPLNKNNILTFTELYNFLFNIIESNLHNKFNNDHHKKHTSVYISNNTDNNSFTTSIESPTSDSISLQTINALKNKKSPSFVMESPLENKNEPIESNSCIVMGIPVNILCRIISDTIINSIWNKPVDYTSMDNIDNNPNLIDSLSYSGFEAYVRFNHINQLERKLKYLLQLDLNNNIHSMNVLFHVFINTQTNHIVAIAYNPISGEIYKYEFDEDISLLPINKSLDNIFLSNKNIEHIVKVYSNDLSLFNVNSLCLYNPWDTPIEDKAINEMVSRLRLIDNSNTYSLILSEEKTFIETLKSLIDHKSDINIPYFSKINELTVQFSIDSQLLSNNVKNNESRDNSKATLEKVVFSTIRKQKQLCNFITNVKSSLKVILSTYNNNQKIVMSWIEMLNYLSDNKNPFITIQLFPNVIYPENYIYDKDYDLISTSNDESADDNISILYQTSCDVDGGKNPQWYEKFSLTYIAPKLTNCKVLSTEIVKLNIDNSDKYVLIMIREGKKRENIELIKKTENSPRISSNERMNTTRGAGKSISFIFFTIYDPRTATEYQCGMIRNSNIYKLITSDETCSLITNINNDSSLSNKLSLFLTNLSDSIQESILKQDIYIGPAITPHLSIKLFNRKGKVDELLGQSQVSISSILSGSGTSKPKWITINNSNDQGKQINAGEICIDMSFRQLQEIEAEKKANEDRIQLLKEKSINRKNSSAISLIPKLQSGDQITNPISNNNIMKGIKIDKKIDSKIDNENLLDTLKNEINILKNDKLLLANENDALKELQQRNVKLINNPKSNNSANRVNNQNSDLKSNESNNKTQLNDIIENQIKEKLDIVNKEKLELNKLNDKLTNEMKILTSDIYNLTTEKTKFEKLYNEIVNSANSNGDSLITLKSEIEKIKNEKSLLLKELESFKSLSNTKKSTSDNSNTSVTNNIINSSSIDIKSNNFNDIIQYLISTLQLRYNNKNSNNKASGSINSNILDPLDRILKSYSTEDDLINSSQIYDAMTDILLNVNKDFCDQLVSKIGKPTNNTLDYIPYKSIITFLKRRIADINNNSSNTPKPKANDIKKVDNTIGNSNVNDPINSNTSISEENKQEMPKAPASPKATKSKARPISASTTNTIPLNDVGIKRVDNNSFIKGSIKPIESKQQLSKTQVVKEDVLTSKDDNNLSKSTNNITITKSNIKSSESNKELSTNNNARSESKLPETTVNWDEVPLPSNAWERRLDKRTSKYYYVNHETKTTQWHHPLNVNVNTKKIKLNESNVNNEDKN